MSEHDTHYLLLSDIHLGADMAYRGRQAVARASVPPAGPPLLDQHLAALLDHYRAEVEPEWRWTLVIAGDVVDFVSMAAAPNEDVRRERAAFSAERHGKRRPDDAIRQAVRELLAVARRHDLAFRALADFVSEGHRLVLVRGNHDLAFYWKPVRRAFVNALFERAGLGDDPAARAAFEARIEFRAWFYYVEGKLYVEHGHLYDETCSCQNVLAPVSPRDPTRLIDSFSDILQRFVVEPTRGLRTAGHENKNLFHYLCLAFSMGLHGCASLGYRFAGSVVRLLQAWLASAGRGAVAVRAEHERRMKRLASRFRLRPDLLRSLASLWAVPVTRRLSSLLRSLFFDVLLALLALGLVLVGIALFELAPLWLLLLLVMPLGAGMFFWIRRRRVFDCSIALRQGARGVAALLPAYFVVMGHTHVPEMKPLRDGVTYVNLGHFRADAGENAPPSPPSHLVLRNIDGRLQAEFVGASLE